MPRMHGSQPCEKHQIIDEGDRHLVCQWTAIESSGNAWVMYSQNCR